ARRYSPATASFSNPPTRSPASAPSAAAAQTPFCSSPTEPDMQVSRATPRPWQATAWVDGAEIAVNGTDTDSRTLDIDIPDVPGITDARLEVEYDQGKASGTSNVYVQVAIANYQGAASVSAGNESGAWRTGQLSTSGASPLRRVSIPLLTFQGLNTGGFNRIRA